MNIVIGLGSGRCGTKSLANLLDAQPDTICFHELNPSSMSWNGAQSSVSSMIRDFQALTVDGEVALTIDYSVPDRATPIKGLSKLNTLTVVGDVASYYLPYVPHMLKLDCNIKFPCLKRNKDETIDSFARKLSGGSHCRKARNHWIADGNGNWRIDPVWDKCFPCFPEIASEFLEDYIHEYYLQYYEMAEHFERRYPENFRIFPTSILSTSSYREELLEFTHSKLQHVDLDVHSNRGTSVKSAVPIMILKEQYNALKVENETLQTDMQKLKQELTELVSEGERRIDDIAALVTELDKSKGRLATEKARRKRDVEMILSSKSWRITAPLRSLKRYLNRAVR